MYLRYAVDAHKANFSKLQKLCAAEERLGKTWLSAGFAGAQFFSHEALYTRMRAKNNEKDSQNAKKLSFS
jgi:hypothetical protein